MLPAQTLQEGWVTVSFVVPPVDRVAGLGLQVNDPGGWTGRIVVDELTVRTPAASSASVRAQG